MRLRSVIYTLGNILTYDIKGEPFKASKNNNLSILRRVVALRLFLIPFEDERETFRVPLVEWNKVEKIRVEDDGCDYFFLLRRVKVETKLNFILFSAKFSEEYVKRIKIELIMFVEIGEDWNRKRNDPSSDPKFENTMEKEEGGKKSRTWDDAFFN